jgi:hypothetical protein
MGELKKCPCCGGDAEYGFVEDEGIRGIVVLCTKCYARTCGFFDEKSAKEAWNKRSYDEYVFDAMGGSLGVQDDVIELPDNVKTHRDICNYLNELYARKNHDYGNSFHKTWLEEGAAAARLRIGDKFNRYKELSRGSDRLVGDETIEDTLIDMANYCIMALMEHRREAEEK